MCIIAIESISSYTRICVVFDTWCTIHSIIGLGMKHQQIYILVSITFPALENKRIVMHRLQLLSMLMDHCNLNTTQNS